MLRQAFDPLLYLPFAWDMTSRHPKEDIIRPVGLLKPLFSSLQGKRMQPLMGKAIQISNGFLDREIQ